MFNNEFGALTKGFWILLNVLFIFFLVACVVPVVIRQFVSIGNSWTEEMVTNKIERHYKAACSARLFSDVVRMSSRATDILDGASPKIVKKSWGILYRTTKCMYEKLDSNIYSYDEALMMLREIIRNCDKMGMTDLVKRLQPLYETAFDYQSDKSKIPPNKIPYLPKFPEQPPFKK